MARAPLVLVANARMPSQRAQSLQVAQAAASFARAGAPTTLLFARRRDAPAIDGFQHAGRRGAEALWSYYAVPEGVRPALESAACIDGIDVFPTRLQYLPARAQELSFAWRAAAVVRARHGGARVLARELEVARLLHGRPGTFLEIHRVPEGRLRRGWLRAAAAEAAGVIAISGGVRDDLVTLGLDPSRLTVEHDAFEARRFADLPERSVARAALGLDAERLLVVYAGGLLAWKGADLVVDAARHLSELAFVVVGGMSTDVERLRERAAGVSNLRIEGFQPPERVAGYLAAADLGLVPNRSRPAISARYTSPLKVFEAMAAGLPLVVSDLPSLREVLDEERALFVEPDDAAALAAGIAALVADPARRAAMAERMRAGAARYTWDARAARILEWMEDRS